MSSSLRQGTRTALFQPGHAAGDFLGAPTWVIVEESVGFLRLQADLPAHVRNPRGQLFGGFTGVYVDLVALATAYAGVPSPRLWLATTSMRIDYLAPLLGPSIVIEGLLVAARGRTRVIDVKFFGPHDDQPAVLATATMRQLPEQQTEGEVTREG